MLAATAVSLVFVLLSALHWYWVFGGKLGLNASVPVVGEKRAFKPGPLATALVAVLLLFAAFVCAAQAGIAGLPSSGLTRIGVGILAVVFAGRAVGDFRLVGVFKRVKDTRFARIDSAIFTPLCIFVSVMCCWLLYGTRL